MKKTLLLFLAFACTPTFAIAGNAEDIDALLVKYTTWRKTEEIKESLILISSKTRRIPREIRQAFFEFAREDVDMAKAKFREIEDPLARISALRGILHTQTEKDKDDLALWYTMLSAPLELELVENRKIELERQSGLAEAIKTVRSENRGGKASREVYRDYYRSLLESDPERAYDELSAETAERKTWVINGAITYLIAADPKKTLDLISTHEHKILPFFLINELAKVSDEAVTQEMLTWLLAHEQVENASSAIGIVLKRYYTLNPEKAIIEATKLISHPFPRLCLEGFLEGWAVDQPKNAAEFSAIYAGNYAGYSFMALALEQWAKQDLPNALLYADELKDENLKEGAVWGIIQGAASEKPEILMAWVTQFDEKLRCERLYDTVGAITGDTHIAGMAIIDRWSQYFDPSTIENADNQAELIKDRSNFLENIAWEVGENECAEFPSILKWIEIHLQSYPKANIFDIMASRLNYGDSADFKLLKESVDKIPKGEERQQTFAQVAETFRIRDPNLLAIPLQWLAELQDESIKLAVLGNVIENWPKKSQNKTPEELLSEKRSLISKILGDKALERADEYFSIY